jgi:lysine 2,3-aminomutase
MLSARSPALENAVERQQARERMLGMLQIVPGLTAILQSDTTLVKKRRQIRSLLSDILLKTFEDDPSIPPLEWILTRNAVTVFRNILSRRNERLAGFSLLRYLDLLVNGKDLGEHPPPRTGFLREIEHLLLAVAGRSELYTDTVPTFLKHTGRKAARMRSSDLSRMARHAQRFMDRYTCGLDQEIVALRAVNRRRLLERLGATEKDWQDWRWHTQHIVRDADTLGALVDLSDEERTAVERARLYRLPFGITPYYLSLFDAEAGHGRDRAVRAQVVPPLSYVERMQAGRERAGCSMDFMIEQDTSPIDGITRRYPQIVILKPVLTCPQICVYCQRNWEIEDVYSEQAMLPPEKLDQAIAWIADTPEVQEVLITGGDPLLLTDRQLEDLLERVTAIDHVERVRIGSRTLVTLPQRITDRLARVVSRFHQPGRRAMLIVTHFEHPYEITPEAMAAVQRFRRAGLEVYNQLVFTFFNSRRFETAALRHWLRLIGVSPYYTFNTKGKEETDAYRVPIARLLQEQQEEARLQPGSVRTDEIVFNVPKLGKNYLKAAQHHDIISILPDGRRVYEFHPWEKKLSLVDTYVYTDVSIHDYLRRLRAIGEPTAQYRSIWYYY